MMEKGDLNMSVELGSLSPGDLYAGGKYKVRSNDGYTITIIRLSDNHLIKFHNTQPNWKHKVEKV